MGKPVIWHLRMEGQRLVATYAKDKDGNAYLKFAPLLDGANWAIINARGSFSWSPRLMSSVEHPTIYDELVDLLAQSADPTRLGSFRLSAGMQDRLDELLQKNRDGTLDDSESAELDAFERFEHVVRVLKARVVQQRRS